MGFIAIRKKSFMTYPLFSISYCFLSAAILFFSAWRIHSYYKKSSFQLAKYFRDMALSAGIGSVIQLFTFTLLVNNPVALGIGTIIGGSFALVAHVYGLTIFFYMTFPRIPSKKVLIAGLILLALVVIPSIISFPYLEIDEKGIVDFNFLPLHKVALATFSTLGLMPLGVAFFREAIAKKHLRTRSGFLAFCFFLFVVANIFQCTVKASQFHLLSFVIFPTIAYIMLFAAVISRVKAADR